MDVSMGNNKESDGIVLGKLMDNTPNIETVGKVQVTEEANKEAAAVQANNKDSEDTDMGEPDEASVEVADYNEGVTSLLEAEHEVEAKGVEREDRRRSERLLHQITLTTQMQSDMMSKKKRNIEGLFKSEFQNQVVEGVGILLSIACNLMVGNRREAPRLFLPAGGNTSGNRIMLEDEEEVDEETNREARSG
ncbi:unnamed protein product [Urochloa humidicola]